MLLPVADLTDSTIKILRVPTEKGAGKLLTEIVKMLSLENREQIVTKITRTKRYQSVVDAHRQDALNPDVAAVIKRFVEQVKAGVADIGSVVTSMPASEMAQHARVAKRLELEGRADEPRDKTD
jgi:pyruvate/2-oxoglutarate/acetoin dehydrogenase E1 component